MCNSTDPSMYCAFIKLVTVVIYTFILFYLLSIAYNYLTSKSMRGGSSRNWFGRN
jgi:hypothetical protein